MESNTISASLIFDGILAIVLLLFMFVNYKRGFSKTFISVIGYVLAIILGCVAGDTGAEPIYNSILKDASVSEIQEVLSKADVSKSLIEDIKKDTYGIVISEDKLKKVISSPNAIYSVINGNDGSEMLSNDEISMLISNSINNAIGESLKSVLPASAVDYMMNSLSSSSDNLYKTATILVTEDSKTSAEYLEETFVRPIVIYIVKMAIFFVVFFIVMILVKLIAKSIENNNSSPTMASVTDKVLGAIFGIIEAVIVLILVSIVLKWIVTSSVATSSILNDDVIQSTTIFKYIYNLDTLKILN